MQEDVVSGGAGDGSPRRQLSRDGRQLTDHNASRGDATFRGLTRTAGVSVLVLIAAIAVFLIAKAVPAIQKDTVNFFTSSAWSPDASPSVFGIAALAAGTLVSSVLALIIGVPVAVGVALFISHYAPRRLAQGLGYIVDLLAAVPSVVYGLWALVYLVPAMVPLSKWLHTYLGFIPIFASDGTYGKSLLVGGVVLAVMILPIVAAISREVFLLAPREHIEAAYALGATRWETMRMVVLPYGRPGVISATVLGFGRALGETIAVALILPANYIATLHILEPKGNSIAANIANVYGDAGDIGRGALIASGLVLFAITLIVNIGARLVVARRREFRAAT
jgi:phosphate transport system permease protein